MTIENTPTSVSYRDPDADRDYPLPFPILGKGNLSIACFGPDGESRELTEDADYRVSMLGNAQQNLKWAAITLVDKPPPGSLLVIRRKIPITQENVFHNQGPNSPAVMEMSLDKAAMICQELSARLDDLPIEKLEMNQDELAQAAASLAGRLDATMPAAPDDGKSYIAAGDRWLPFDPGAGEIFTVDGEGFVVPAQRAAYAPSPVWQIEAKHLSVSPSALPGERDSHFAIDAEGYCVAK